MQPFTDDHMKLARTIAWKFYKRTPANIDLDDLIQVAYLGLIDAAKKFIDDGRAKFETYAAKRITGQLLDFLREQDTQSRRVRVQMQAMKREETSLAHRLGRHPSPGEVAVYMGKEVREVEALRQEVEAAELDEVHDMIVSAAPDPCMLLEQAEEIDVAMRGVDSLPPNERLVIKGIFFEDRTLAELGLRLGVTESRACQLKGQGLQRLKELLS